MNPILSDYLTEKQFQKICRYWRIIDKLEYKISNYNWLKLKTIEEFSDDEETVIKHKTHNEYFVNEYDELNLKLNHFEEEYANYIHKLGFELNDKTQNEHLYYLLNDGICLKLLT